MKAFTLIELLVVIAIIAIVSAFTVPAMQSLGASQSLTGGGGMVADQIALARQTAVARNRTIEMRFIELTDAGSPAIRAVQLWMETEDGTTLSPLNRMEILPNGVAISSNELLSPLLTAEAGLAGTANFPGQGNRSYKAFQIRASGLLGSGVISSNNFLTLHRLIDSGIPPKNFSTLRVNPITAHVTEYRP